MGRPRKPTAVLELNGAFKINPQRKKAREGEPTPTTPLGKPPSDFSEEQCEIWEEFRRYGFWLTSPDCFMVEVATKLMDQHRRSTIQPKEISILVATLNKLGFGPAERSKIKAPSVAKDNRSSFGQFRR